jgi:hypothetical protein
MPIRPEPLCKTSRPTVGKSGTAARLVLLAADSPCWWAAAPVADLASPAGAILHGILEACWFGCGSGPIVKVDQSYQSHVQQICATASSSRMRADEQLMAITPASKLFLAHG